MEEPQQAQCPRVFALYRSLHDALDHQAYEAMFLLACQLETELRMEKAKATPA